ncbi:hypothetical protein [Flavobacterium sp.]|uniref:hypothetical protein n=1 Tax=Flavobacterium sp. TaxID=239 RepID=UPI0038FC233C
MKTTTLLEFQNAFNLAIENTENKKFVIETEIDEIKNYINYIPNFKTFQKPVKSNLKNKANKIFDLKISDLLRDLFSDAFNQHMQVGTYKLEKSHSDTPEMYKIKEDTVKQASEFSEYYKWLSNYNFVPQKEEEFNVGLRLLSLEYLGVDLLNNDKTKIARTLAPIIGMHQQTIRTSLTYLHIDKNEIRTIGNLLKLQEFFKNQGHTSIVLKIQKDIEAIK